MPHLLINLESSLHKKLKHMAIDRDTSLEQIVIQLLERSVNDSRLLLPGR